jgi:hypothetical protein
MLTSLTIRIGLSQEKIWLVLKDCHFLHAFFFSSRLYASWWLASKKIIHVLLIRNLEISLKWPLVVAMLSWWWHSFQFTLVLFIMNSSRSPSNYLLHQHMHAVISLAGIWFKLTSYKIFIYCALSIFTSQSHAHLFFRDATTVGLIKARPTYPFGVDPVWHGSRSELPFLNSLKMKMSILIGVTQMNLGIILSYFNAAYFRNSLNVW